MWIDDFDFICIIVVLFDSHKIVHFILCMLLSRRICSCRLGCQDFNDKKYSSYKLCKSILRFPSNKNKEFLG